MAIRRRFRLALALAAIAALPALPSAAAAAGKPANKHRHVPPPPQLALTPALTAPPGVAIVMPPVGLSIENPWVAAALGTWGSPAPPLTSELRLPGSRP